MEAEMISDLLFSRTVIPDLMKSMDAYSLRQTVLSNNIANAMTPGFRAQRVSFEEEYRRSLASDPTNLRGTRTHERHIRIPNITNPTIDQVRPHVEFRENRMNDSGLNNVDIDQEMAEMAENSLRYEMSTKLTKKRIANIRSAIRGRG